MNKIKWEWIGNTDSLSEALSRVKKYDIEHPDYIHKIGEPKGKNHHSWQTGLYRRKK